LSRRPVRKVHNSLQGRDPIGNRIRVEVGDGVFDHSMREVVGIVGDIKHNGLTAAVVPQYYPPYTGGDYESISHHSHDWESGTHGKRASCSSPRNGQRGTSRPSFNLRGLRLKVGGSIALSDDIAELLCWYCTDTRSHRVVWPPFIELAEVRLSTLADGHVRVRNLWMSVDPYMRGRMRDYESYPSR